MMREVRQSTLIVVASIALLLSACSTLAPQAQEGSLQTYFRNPAELALGVQIDSATEGGGWSRLADSHGCSSIGVPWTITIGTAAPEGPVGEYAGLLTSGDLADPTNAEIWIDVSRDGNVSWGEGRPDWAPDNAPSSCDGD